MASDLKTAHQPADKPFDYNAAEWVEIEGSIKAAREKPVSEDERASLRRAADDYRRAVAERASGRYVSPKRSAQLYSRAARLSGQLRDAIQDSGRSRYGDAWPSKDGALIPRELTQRLVSSLLGPGRNFDVPAASVALLSFGDVVDLLNVLQDALVSSSSSGMSLIYSISGRRDPPVVYYQRVLLLWKDTFRGRLAISRDSQDPSKIAGPLIRYFFAVTRPVMGNRTPSLQSLPDIVDRQKVFDDWWTAYKRLCDEISDKTDEKRWADYVLYLEARHPDLARQAKRLHSAMNKLRNGEVRRD
jgi:hypothetical protein